MTPFELQAIDHVVIRAADARRLLAFYVDALGCKLVWDRPELGLTHLQAGSAMIDIVDIEGPLGRNGVSRSDGQGRNCRTVRTRGTSFMLLTGSQEDGPNDQGRPRYPAQAQGAAPC